MRVLAMTRYGYLGASSRVRTFQYIQPLKALGADVCAEALLRDEYLLRLYASQATDWVDLIKDYMRRMIRLLRAPEFDLLWIEKELFPNLPAWFEPALAALGIRYVVDYDDAIFHNYDLSTNPLKKLLANKIDKVMRGAQLVVCGNMYLAERARKAGARQVEILPTAIDLERYKFRDKKPKESIVIGWVGSPTTVKYLEVAAPALQAIAAEFNVKLCVIGARFDMPGLDVEYRPWTEGTEVSDIQEFDIGIMPLSDTPWERGKCGYKLIQYMACGLPVIASPVGVNTKIIEPGSNGFLANSDNEWHSALVKLMKSFELRASMGAQGRGKVEKQYCLQVTAPKLYNLLCKAAN